MKTLSKKKERKAAIKKYYDIHFEDEFIELTNLLKREDLVIECAMENELRRFGFQFEDDVWTKELDNEFSNFEIRINGKRKRLVISVELYNPTSGDMLDDGIYKQILDYTENRFYEILRERPCIKSSLEYGCDYDESFTFSVEMKPCMSCVQDFIEATNRISTELHEGKYCITSGAIQI